MLLRKKLVIVAGCLPGTSARSRQRPARLQPQAPAARTTSILPRYPSTAIHQAVAIIRRSRRCLPPSLRFSRRLVQHTWSRSSALIQFFSMSGTLTYYSMFLSADSLPQLTYTSSFICAPLYPPFVQLGSSPSMFALIADADDESASHFLPHFLLFLVAVWSFRILHTC